MRVTHDPQIQKQALIEEIIALGNVQKQTSAHRAKIRLLQMELEGIDTMGQLYENSLGKCIKDMKENGQPCGLPGLDTLNWGE